MQLLPMASSPDGLISAQYAVITKTPGWGVLSSARGGSGGDCCTVSRPGRDEDRGRDGDKRWQTEGILALHSVTRADKHLVHTLLLCVTHPVTYKFA